MDLRQLAALVAVAETGTFSAAADVLHTVQSNVSTHIARLERELGVTLVDRAAGRLTEEGVAVVARARRVQAELAALTADVASLRDEVVGRVRMGVIGTPGPWLVPPLLRLMAERHPRVDVGVLEGNTTSLLPALISGDLDLAVVNLPVTDSEVKVDPLFDEDLVVVAPDGHPLAGRERVTLIELAGHQLLLPPTGTSIRVDLDDAAAEAGVTLQTMAELDGLRLIAELSFQGFGPAVLPSSGVPRAGGEAWRRVEIEDPPVRRVGLAVRRRGLASAPSRVLAECIVEVVTDRARDLLGIEVTARPATR
jgi:LysR family hydrogen peroxide-inducible transcriptional activator